MGGKKPKIPKPKAPPPASPPPPEVIAPDSSGLDAASQLADAEASRRGRSKLKIALSTPGVGSGISIPV